MYNIFRFVSRYNKMPADAFELMNVHTIQYTRTYMYYENILRYKWVWESTESGLTFTKTKPHTNKAIRESILVENVVYTRTHLFPD